MSTSSVSRRCKSVCVRSARLRCASLASNSFRLWEAPTAVPRNAANTASISAMENQDLRMSLKLCGDCTLGRATHRELRRSSHVASTLEQVVTESKPNAAQCKYCPADVRRSRISKVVGPLLTESSGRWDQSYGLEDSDGLQHHTSLLAQTLGRGGALLNQR